MKSHHQLRIYFVTHTIYTAATEYSEHADETPLILHLWEVTEPLETINSAHQVSHHVTSQFLKNQTCLPKCRRGSPWPVWWLAPELHGM